MSRLNIIIVVKNIVTLSDSQPFPVTKKIVGHLSWDVVASFGPQSQALFAGLSLSAAKVTETGLISNLATSVPISRDKLSLREKTSVDNLSSTICSITTNKVLSGVSVTLIFTGPNQDKQLSQEMLKKR